MNAKLTVLTILGLFLIHLLKAQENYRAIRVNGDIKIVNKGIPLVRGTTLNNSDELSFGSPNDNAIAISSKGRYFIRPQNYGSNNASTSYLPALANVSSRGASDMQSLSALFTGMVALFPTNTIPVNTEKYQLSNKRFFFISYQYNGEIINKKLDHVDDNLVITSTELFKVDGKPINKDAIQQMSLFYLETDNMNKKTRIGVFEPIVPNQVELKEEVEIIISTLKEIEKEEKTKQIKSYLNDVYGQVSEKTLEIWLKNNFNF